MITIHHGFYNESGEWQRTKFCMLPCRYCTCGPPNGLWYDASKDTGKRNCHTQSQEFIKPRQGKTE